MANDDIKPSKGYDKRQLTFIGVAVAVVVICFALFSLSRKSVPSPKMMARVMADMYTVDALLQDYVCKSSDDKTPERLYHTVLDHYGLTRAQYDSAVCFYTQDPKLFGSVYDRVIAILSERDSQMEQMVARQDSSDRARMRTLDSLRVSYGSWADMYVLPLNANDSLNARIVSTDDCQALSYSFPLNNLSGGRLTFKQRYTFGKDNKAISAFAQINVHYADGSSDGVRDYLQVTKKVIQKSMEFSFDLNDSLAATSVDVSLVSAKSLTNTQVTLRNVSLSYLPQSVVDDSQSDVFDFSNLFNY